MLAGQATFTQTVGSLFIAIREQAKHERHKRPNLTLPRGLYSKSCTIIIYDRNNIMIVGMVLSNYDPSLARIVTYAPN
jgi:hypothetical protein